MFSFFSWYTERSFVELSRQRWESRCTSVWCDGYSKFGALVTPSLGRSVPPKCGCLVFLNCKYNIWNCVATRRTRIKRLDYKVSRTSVERFAQFGVMVRPNDGAVWPSRSDATHCVIGATVTCVGQTVWRNFSPCTTIIHPHYFMFILSQSGQSVVL